jgi:hypothetical protein
VYKKLAVLGTTIIFLACCGVSLWLFVFNPCDFEGYLDDPKIRDEFFKALDEYEQTHGLILESWGWPQCTSSTSDLEFYVQYETPSHLSKYGLTYWMSFVGTYSLSSKEINLQYEDIVTDDIYDAVEFINLIENQLPEFENTSEVQEFVNNLRSRSLEGSIWGDRFVISTNRTSIPIAQTGEFASLEYSMTTHSISSFNLPNRLPWPGFSELSFAHRIIQEHYLERELEGCSIDTDRGEYANTHVLHRTDGTIRIDVNIQCPIELENDILRLILFPDGTYKYDGLW